MNSDSVVRFNKSWLGVIVVLFGLLFVASQGNEVLKQIVMAPGSAAALGEPANCRADELEEEGLSLLECELLVSSVQITLVSTPNWFRLFQIGLSSVAVVVGVMVISQGIAVVNNSSDLSKLMVVSVAALFVLDVIGFIAATNLGPLLRAQYLWSALLWIAIHLCMLIAIIRINSDNKRQQSVHDNV